MVAGLAAGPVSLQEDVLRDYKDKENHPKRRCEARRERRHNSERDGPSRPAQPLALGWLAGRIIEQSRGGIVGGRHERWYFCPGLAARSTVTGGRRRKDRRRRSADERGYGRGSIVGRSRRARVCRPDGADEHG